MPYYSKHLYEGDGSTHQFAVSFVLGYLHRLHVKAQVGDEVSLRELTWMNDGFVSIGEPPADGVPIWIYRDTPKDVLIHTYEDGASIIQKNLDESNLQTIMIVHEATDNLVIDLEAQGAVNADLQDQIEQEVADRIAAVSQEEAERKAADLVLHDRVSTETIARQAEIAQEASYRAAADVYLQDQISGAEPLLASAFSPISWHEQEILSSVSIPENKNAWSFGPVMTVTPSATVTIGAGSFWTIANGEVQA